MIWVRLESRFYCLQCVKNLHNFFIYITASNCPLRIIRAESSAPNCPRRIAFLQLILESEINLSFIKNYILLCMFCYKGTPDIDKKHRVLTRVCKRNAREIFQFPSAITPLAVLALWVPTSIL